MHSYVMHYWKNVQMIALQTMSFSINYGDCNAAFGNKSCNTPDATSTLLAECVQQLYTVHFRSTPVLPNCCLSYMYT